MIAGQKKDLVVTNRLWRKAGRVAIYGWRTGAGAPIQPLSTVHGARYADYSHGVRLVGALAYVNGQPRSIFDVLGDPSLAGIASDEGPILRLANLIEAAPPPREPAEQGNGTPSPSHAEVGRPSGSPLRSVAAAEAAVGTLR